MLFKKIIPLLQALITSKTRIKLLLRFFLNTNNRSYLRDLASEFGESTNAIRLELNHLENAGLLKSEMQRNKKIFKANTLHPLFDPIHQLILKHTGIDKIIDFVVMKLQGLERAYVVGNFARGIDHPEVDLILTGNNIDAHSLQELTQKAEKIISRKINTQTITATEIEEKLKYYPEALLLWVKTND